ncbi:hypothetical protein GOODEAATRI_009253 [Goodea atripinnis]|uniref:Urocanase Rossmann-like domain-containing protein n=1 Tax=Goodea atripinnis TaxID=208336 RepID=A0ABV0PMP1_9TELE
MSGAQAKAAVIAGCVGVIAEVRWLQEERLLLEFERTGELLVDLGSDQTSLHNPYNGGYYPVPLSLRQANQLMSTDPGCFRSIVQERLDSS